MPNVPEDEPDLDAVVAAVEASSIARARDGKYGCNPLGKCREPFCPDCPDLGIVDDADPT